MTNVDFKEENKERIDEVRTKMVHPTIRLSIPIIIKESKAARYKLENWGPNLAYF